MEKANHHPARANGEYDAAAEQYQADLSPGKMGILHDPTKEYCFWEYKTAITIPFWT